MNTKLFKHIFSKRLNALVVVGENAHSDGKKTGLGVSSVEKLVISTSTMSPNRFFGLLSLGFICVSSALADPVMDVLPTNGVVVQGAASITQQTHLMTINQATDKAVINWQGFDIGHGATVNVVQPTSQSVLLNRVVGNNASQIFGTLNANGHVILVNPNGIVFGADGSVNASAFTASTLGITDADFMAGNYYFTANGSNGTIVNQGSINTNGGYVALLGASVTNDGKITTNYGNAYLAAAESILLPITNSGRIKMELSPASINAAVNNTKNGLIVTAGGQVLMQASAVNDAVAMGMVTNAGHIDTVAAQGGDVNLLTDGGNIRVSGSINASSQDSTKAGGQIIIGRDLETNILAANTDASGAMLTSKGGFVETSGAYLVTTGTRVWAKEWLLDPTNIIIAETNAVGTQYDNSFEAQVNSTILASDIVANLNVGTNVSIATTANGADEGNITINASIEKTQGDEATLALTAHNNISINAAVTSTFEKLNVTLNTAGAGGVSSNVDGVINTNGGVLTLNTTNASASGNLAGDIIGIGSVLKTGIGLATLSGSKTYTGATTVQAGNLVGLDFGSPNHDFRAFGHGVINIDAGATAFVNNINGTGHNNFRNNVAGAGTLQIAGPNFNRILVLGNFSNMTGTIDLVDRGVQLTGSVNTTASVNIRTGATLHVFAVHGEPIVGALNGSGRIATINGGNGFITIGRGGADGTFSGVITNELNGPVHITKIGDGTQTLSGNNTHTGVTLVNEGTLALGHVNALRNSILDTGAVGPQQVTFVVPGDQTYNIGALRGADDLAFSANNLSVGGRNLTTIYSGEMSGSGNFVKVGTGTQILTGNQTYTGTTTISSGTLQIGNDTTSGTLGIGDVINNANLTFDRSDTLEVDNTISGTGTLNQVGSGTTTLIADNTYSGATTVSGGTLQIGNGDALGSLGNTSGVTLSNNANLVFDKNINTTIDKDISGDGNVTANIIGNLALTSVVNLTGNNNTINLAVSEAISQTAGSLKAENLFMTATNGGIGETNNRIQSDVNNLLFSAASHVFVTNASNMMVAGFTTSGGNIDIATTGGRLRVDTVNSINGLTAQAAGNITLDANTLVGDGLDIAQGIIALQGDITLNGTTADTTSNAIAGIVSRPAATVRANNITLTGNAIGNAGNVLGHRGAGASFDAAQQLTLIGSSNNNGAGFYSFNGSYKSGTGVTITGTSKFGTGVGLDSHVTINNTGVGGISITGEVIDNINQKAISMRGVSITNSAGNVSLNAVDGDIFSHAGNPNAWGGGARTNTITNTATGGNIKLRAGTRANADGILDWSVDGIVDGSVLDITQQSNGGVLVESMFSEVWIPKITNSGSGDVIVAAGSSRPLKAEFGGNVQTVAGNTITNNAKTFIYTGSVFGAGDLSVLNADYANLALADSGFKANAQFNSVFGNTITDGANSQVLFRQALDANGRFTNNNETFKLDLTNITKVYGSADVSGASLITAFTNAYNGPKTLTFTQASITQDSGNTFQMLAANAISQLNVSTATRVAGENVNGGTPYAFSNIVGGAGVEVVTQGGLVITPKALSITANTISGTYSGATYDAFATAAGVTSVGLVNATINGVVINDSITSVSSTFKTDLVIDSGNVLTGSNVAQAGNFNRTIDNAMGTGLENYTISYNGNTGAIGTATVTLNSVLATGSMVYDGTTRFLGSNFSITGVSGDTFTASGAGVLATANVQSSQPLQSLGDLTLIPVGSANLSNYNSFTVMNTSVSVTPASLSVTGINNAVTYNGLLQKNAGALVTGQQGLDSFTISGYGTGTGAGSYDDALVVSGANNSNYNLTKTDGSLTINKAPINILIDNKTTTYGSVVPLTYRVSGFVNGDNASAFNISVNQPTTTGFTSASTTNNVGDYAINASINASNTNFANYILMDVTNGNLQITPAPLTLTVQDTSKLVTQDDPSLSYSISGLVNGDLASVFTAPTIIRESGETAGIYAVNLSGGSAPNYDIVKNNGIFEIIGAQRLLITMKGVNTTYGTLGFSEVIKAQYVDADLISFYTLTNTESNVWSDGVGGTIQITPTLTGVSVESNVGIYKNAVNNINTGTDTSAGNFISVITQPANYLVNPATLTIGASNINRVFDGSAFNLDSVFKPTATSVGFVNGEDFSTLGGVTFAGSAINSTNVGTFTYGVTANGNPNGNYAITYLSPAKLVTSSVDGNSQQPDPFVNPVTPKPIPPTDTTSTTGSSANAGSFQLARNIRLYAPDQCSDNTGL